MSRHSQSVIKQLLVQDGQRVTGIGFKNSVFLQLLREIDYVTGITSKHGQDVNTPHLATILLFCSAVDVSGRILNRRLPGRGENKQFFIDAAVTWYGMNTDEAIVFWEIRNLTSHQFNPTLNSHLIHGIAPVYTVIDLKSKSGVPFIFTGSITSTFERAMSYIWHEFSENSQEQKELDAQFINSNCFFYSRHPVSQRKNHENAVLPSLNYRLKKVLDQKKYT